MPFLAAVAVFALGVGGLVASLSAFVIFALTVGALVFVLALLGAGSAQALARPLRLWGRRVQAIAAVIIVLVGVALVLEGINPDFLDELLLG